MVKKTDLKVEPKTMSLSSPSSKSASNKRYKGVRMRSWGSYVSEIRAPNQKTRIWLGSYSTPEAAARAYDAALICLKGLTAIENLNFPDSSFDCIDIEFDQSCPMSPKSIQKVAAAAANSFTDHTITTATATASTSTTTTTTCSFSPYSSPISMTTFSPSTSDQMAASTCYDSQPIDADFGVASAHWFDDQCNTSNFDGFFEYPKFAFNTPVIDDVYASYQYEDVDIQLWSFS